MAADEGFLASLRAGAKPWWEAVGGRWDQAAWDALQAEAFAEAIPAVREGRPPTGPRERAAVSRYLDGIAAILGRPHDAAFAPWLLSLWDRGDGARSERFWELVAIVRRWRDAPPYAAAHRWLRDGIRHLAADAVVSVELLAPVD
jgi:hypothetical protein